MSKTGHLETGVWANVGGQITTTHHQERKKGSLQTLLAFVMMYGSNNKFCITSKQGEKYKKRGKGMMRWLIYVLR